MVGFRSDLQRWTEAQLRRRAQDGDLAHAIRRLIDYPYAQEDQTPIGRGAIPGRVGTALRQQRAPATFAALIMERGLGLVVNGAFGIACNTSLVDAWAATPQDWGWEDAPGIGETPHAQGQMSAGAFLCAVGTAPTWTGAPTLGAANEYQSSASAEALTQWVNDANRDPAKFTGLMRLAAEAWGPHADISDIRPATGGWFAWNPLWYGILRQRDDGAGVYRWWLTYLGPSGCVMAKLTPSPLVQCLEEGIYSGNWDQEQTTLAEAWVLRTCSVADGETIHTLLTEGDMLPATGDGFWPLAHGWHFSPQAWGTASEAQTEAVICTAKDQATGAADGWDTHGCQVVVSFSGETPSAVITQSHTGAPRLGDGTQMWIPLGPSWQRENEHSGAAVAGLVWARYRADGPQWVTYQGETITQEQSTGIVTSATSRSCGAGGGHEESDNYAHTRWQAGYDVSGAAVAYKSGAGWGYIHSFTTSGDAQYSGYLTQSAGSAVGSWSGPYPNDPPVDCESASYADVGSPNTCTVQTTRVNYQIEQRQYEASGGGRGVALIISADPTVLIGCYDTARKLGSEGKNIGVNDGRVGYNLTASGSDGSVNVSLAIGGWNGGNSGAIGNIVYYDDVAFNRNTTWRTYVSSEGIDMEWTNGIDPGGFVYDTEAQASDAYGEILLSKEHDDWKVWARPGDFGSPGILTGLVFRASYTGQVLYTLAAGADLVSDVGYDAAALSTASAVRFLGGG